MEYFSGVTRWVARRGLTLHLIKLVADQISLHYKGFQSFTKFFSYL
jgi:hypothetical protein